MTRHKVARTVVMAVVSDVHAGGTTALCPDKIVLDDGGEYHASKAQRWLMQCWRDYWAAVQAKRDALNAELYVVFNGDCVEGDHHKTTQIMSANPNAQAAVWTEVVRIPLALKPDHIVITRGTAAHVGQSASAEERIADGLRRDKRPIVSEPETGAASWWHWRPEIHGVRLSVTHHGRIGQREHTRSSQIVLYAHDVHLTHTKNGERPPDLALRGHNHKVADSFDAVKPRVVATGAWQLGTGHVHQVQPDSLADIQGVIVTLRPGEYDVDKIHFRAERPVWTPE
jgi:hypothetical protein